MDATFVENLAVYCIRYSFHAQLTRVYFGLILFETEPDCQSLVSDLNLAKDKGARRQVYYHRASC